jgi:hypothetical protein
MRRATLLGVVASLLVFSAPVWADFTFTGGPTVRTTPVGSEQTIVTIYEYVYGSGVLGSDPWEELDDLFIADDEVWPLTQGFATAQARFAGYEQEFGFYTDLLADGGDGSDMTEIFTIDTTSGFLTGPEQYFSADGASAIGFYRNGTEGPWYSEVGLNTADTGDQPDHMLAFSAPNGGDTILLFWEDIASNNLCGYDFDFNDLAVEIEGLNGGGGEIPEPSTMLLLLTGLTGIAYWRKRK